MSHDVHPEPRLRAIVTRSLVSRPMDSIVFMPALIRAHLQDFSYSMHSGAPSCQEDVKTWKFLSRQPLSLESKPKQVDLEISDSEFPEEMGARLEGLEPPTRCLEGSWVGF